MLLWQNGQKVNSFSGTLFVAKAGKKEGYLTIKNKRISK